MHPRAWFTGNQFTDWARGVKLCCLARRRRHGGQLDSVPSLRLSWVCNINKWWLLISVLFKIDGCLDGYERPVVCRAAPWHLEIAQIGHNLLCQLVRRVVPICMAGSVCVLLCLAWLELYTCALLLTSVHCGWLCWFNLYSCALAHLVGALNHFHLFAVLILSFPFLFCFIFYLCFVLFVFRLFYSACT